MLATIIVYAESQSSAGLSTVRYGRLNRRARLRCPMPPTVTPCMPAPARPILLKYQGAAVVDGQFGGWKAIGAERTGTGFDVAWKMDCQDQYVVWHTDANGNWQSQS